MENFLARLCRALPGSSWEVVVVDDDSPDGTGDIVERFAAREPRVRLLRRTGRPDQAQAVWHGLRAARGSILGSMNADGSHPPEAVTELLAAARAGAPLVVGSRYMAGSAIERWPLRRRLLSRLSNWYVKRLLDVPFTDPLSGFYLLRREIIDALGPEFAPHGFKIMLQIYARARPLRVVEVPYTFQNRLFGKSKLSAATLWLALRQSIVLWRTLRLRNSSVGMSPRRSPRRR